MIKQNFILFFFFLEGNDTTRGESTGQRDQGWDLPTVPLSPLSAATIRAERPLVSTALISAPWRSTSWSPATSSANAAACRGVLQDHIDTAQQMRRLMDNKAVLAVVISHAICTCPRANLVETCTCVMNKKRVHQPSFGVSGVNHVDPGRFQQPLRSAAVAIHPTNNRSLQLPLCNKCFLLMQVINFDTDWQAAWAYAALILTEHSAGEWKGFPLHE